jgi:hypothetical protein
VPVVAAFAVGVAGCSDVLGLGNPTVGLSLETQRAIAPTPVLWVHMGATIGVVPAPAEPGRTERALDAPRYGTVPVRVALVDAAGDTLATTAFSQRFRLGEHHWIAGLVGARRPFGHCIGTLAVAPPRRGGADTLFVMYGSIREGAIC